MNRYRALAGLRSEHESRCAQIRARLREFAAVRTEDMFYELAYCLLTPQSSAVHADCAVRALRERGFLADAFDPTPILRSPDAYIRFHNTKARRLLEVRAQSGDIVGHVETARRARTASPDGNHEIRRWLVDTVRGLGMKEASHFLRNVGFRDLAILDRHILRNLVHHGVLRSVPAALTTTRYLTIERRFHAFASRIGIPVDELDLLFWSRETGEIRK